MSAADQFNSSLNKAADTGGYTTGILANDVPQIIGYILNVLLGLLGLALVILLVYAGYLYLTSQGNDEQIKKAKGTITNAIIGIAIVASAYAASGFVIQALYCATVDDPAACTPGTSPTGAPSADDFGNA